MKYLSFFLLFCLSNSLYAQDFTNALQKDSISSENIVLVIPFKSQFLLSQIDRGLSNNNPDKNILEIRSQISDFLSKELSNQYADSTAIICNSITLLQNEDASNLSYIQHHLSYGYHEIIDPALAKSDKKKLFSKVNKKEKGFETEIVNGQIRKKPIYQDRYMAGTLKNEEIQTFISTEYRASIIVVLTELDLMKAEDAEEKQYTATLHYNILNTSGEILEGKKISETFYSSDFGMIDMQSNVLTPLCSTIHKRSMLYLAKKTSVAVESDDEKDY